MKRKLAVLLSLGALLLIVSLVRLLAGQTLLRLVPSAPAPGHGTNLSFKLQLQGGSTSVVYVIQTSTNLANWQPLVSGKTTPGTTVQLGGVNPTNKAQFFRVQEFGPGLTDTNPPSWTNGVGGRLAVSSPSSIVVNWNAASDDVGVAVYLLYVNGVLVTNVTADVLAYQFVLNLHQPADIRIEAQDASGNSSGILPLVYLPGDRLLAASDDCGRIYVAYVQTNGTFSPLRQIAQINNDDRGLALADFDRDGVLDLIAGGPSGNTMTPYFFKGKGDGTFAAPVPLPTAAGANSYTMSATIGDFDGDGNIDFVVNGNERYVFFYWGNGDGTFTLEVKDWGCCGRGLVGGDFDEDGRDDLARATASDGRVRLFLSNGDRTFTETNQVGRFGGDPYGLVADDFNEDGHLDILENNSSSGDVVFYAGNGDGTFTSLGTNGPWANLDLNDYAGYGSGEFNGDGHRDFIMATYYGHSVWFFPGNGDGTFATNSVQLSSGLCNALGISGPPRPPRVEVGIVPRDPVTNLNGTIAFTAVGAGVTTNDFFRWTFGDSGTNALAWTFGPGTNNMGQSVSHAYGREGRFLTRLWHTSTNGINSVRGTWVTIQGNPPVANPGGPYLFGSEVATQGVWYATLDASASTDDFGIVSYAWNFGDGAAVTNSAPLALHGWPTSGVYTVTLTVMDAARQKDTKSTSITFTNGLPPTAVITGPVIVDETVAHNGTWTATFNGSSSSSPVGIWKYSWRNNYNGQTGTSASFQTTWNAAGTNTITLTVTGNDSQTNSTTYTVWVKANDPPVPVIQGPHLLTVNQATNGLWYGIWNATNSTDDTGIYVYSWKFGDGATASGPTVSHNYAAQGVYPLVLTVTDNGNQSVSTTQNVVVVAGNPPVARISASTLTPEGAQPINFSAAGSTSDNGIYLYTWFLPPRSFDFSGQYLDPNQWLSANAVQNNKVTISGQNTWGVSYFFSVGMLLQRGCTIQGTVDTPSTDGSHAMVGLKNTDVSSGNYNRYPYAIYFANGNVQIYENGNNRGTPTNYVKGTSYDFRIETKPGAGARYYLRPSGTGADFTQIFETGNYTDSIFSFGADVYGGVFGFEHFLVSGGVVTTRDFTSPIFPGGTVTLQVVDAALLTNATSVTIAPVTGAAPAALINGPTNGPSSIQLAFNGYGSSDDYGIASYTWDFGDGSPVAFGPAVTHSYIAPGTYTNTLTVSDYAAQTASAALVVTISGSNVLLHVPWLIVGGIEQPHEIYAGKTNTLKAVARSVPVPFMYVWDYGDGSGTVTNWVSNSATLYNLEARHAYSGGDGTPYYAKISVTLTNGDVFQDSYPLLMRAKSIDIEEKVAIDEGLWYLQKTQNRYDIDATTKGGNWTDQGYYINATASSVQAFAVNGHLLTDDPSRDPYVDTVQRGINYLLSALTTYSIGAQTYGDPDGNHNGLGLSANSGRPIYETGAMMDALVAAGRPELVAGAGAVNVKGRLFRDILQDMVDMYCWGQCQDPTLGGGWRYGWHDGPDNSASQWGAIGMLAAQDYWGIPIPDWVKARNQVWLNYSTDNLGFGYTGPGGVGAGPNGDDASTPSALIQATLDGIPSTNALWLHGLTYIGNYWSSLMGNNNVYANYSMTKAMRTALPSPIINLPSGKNWFLDTVDGMARVTIDHQAAEGSWTSSRYVAQGHATPWSILILSSSLFQQGPVAVITVKPNPSAIGYPVVFDGSLSYHKHPGYKITDWRWVFDTSKGLDFEHPDAVGPIVTNVYGALGTNTIALRVADNSTPQLFDIASVVVQTTTPPYPPTADAGGPYVACAGQNVHLDGSGSFCVDAAAGNFIQSYDWEVDYQVPVTFDQGVTGVRAVITNGYATAGAYQIGLRVKNANSLVYTNFALPDQTADAFTIVYVFDRVIPDLRVRPKATKAQLTWTKAGDYDVVMRSTVGPDRGFTEVGRTASTYATFLDTSIEYETEYYYRVYAYVNGQPNPIGVSDPVFLVSPPRNFDEHAPHFQATPQRFAKVGQLYEVTLDAVDPENKPMFFSLLSGPTNLTVTATSGLVDWTPLASQVGNQFLSFQVSNNIGRDVLSYGVFVFPASNSVPVASVNGPYAALINQDIQFSSAGTSDADGDRLRYYWNFGDGSTSTNINPVHAYGGIGDYLVTLFVNDGYGGTASAQTHAVITRPNRAPIAVVSNAPSFTVRLGEVLTLNGAGSYDLDGDPMTFTWVWGDGTGSTNAASRATHSYAAVGGYAGLLIVADNRGGIGTANFNVTVGASNQPPVIVMTLSTNQPFAMTTVTCDATGSTDADGDPMTFVWDFGDATRTTGSLVSHQYRSLGSYVVTLTVSDNHGGVSVATQPVQVINAPPVFTSNPPLMTRVGTNYSYTPTLSDVDGDAATFQLVQGPVTMSCATNTGTLNWLPGTNELGPNDIILRATDAGGAFTDQAFTLVVTTPLGPQIDLLPTHVAMTNVQVDAQTLAISGAVTVYLTNAGPDVVPVPFTVSVFVDANQDGAYSTNSDRLVAYGQFGPNLPGGGSGWITFTNISGQALFKDAPLYAFVDSQKVVPEYNELNNIMSSFANADTNHGPAIDLSASFLQVTRTGLPTNGVLRARLGNSGYVAVPADVPLAFYDGNPAAGGTLIGVARSTAALVPGAFQDLSVDWTNPAIAVHTIYAVADDPGTGTNLYPEITLANNTLSNVVDLTTVLPPVADAGVRGSVVVGTTVVLNGGNSTDPQGKALTYHWSLLSLPLASRTQVTGTDTATPSFLADAPGPYTFQLVVNNGILDSTNSASIVVTAVDTNLDSPPTITSTPSFQGMVGVQYTYQVTATDPLNKPLTFRLPQSPAGMTINTNTGLVRWMPAAPTNLLVQVAADGPGGSCFQTYSLTIIAFTNLPPQFVSTPVQTATPGVGYTYAALAISPVSNSISYSLTQKPAGMNINANSGVITWTPATSQMGANSVTVVANDGHGGSATQSYNIVVLTAGANGPVVQPIPDQTVTAPATFASIPLDNYVTDPNYPASQMSWTVSGTNLLAVTIDANRVATITYPSGINAAERVTFLATDPSGNSAYASPLLTVIGNGTPPIAAIANLSSTDTTSIDTGFFELKGTADDPGVPVPVAWRIGLYNNSGLRVADVTPGPVDAGGWHEGRVPAGGSFGSLDFTLVQNGDYTLMLEVQANGQVANATAQIALDSKLKIGEVRFSQQDIVLPVQGVALQVNRFYDSINPSAADFGYSWTYSVADLGLTVDDTRVETQDETDDTFFSLRTGGSWDVTLTMPDTGRRITFRFSLNQGSFTAQAVWTPPAGTRATLVPTCSPILVTLPGGLPPIWQAAGIETDWQAFDWPGFILTTADGTQYQITREDLGDHFYSTDGGYGGYVHSYTGGYLTRITQPSGDHTDLVHSGTMLQNIVQYNATNQQLKSILFQRDPQQRINAVYTPENLSSNGAPVGPASVIYTYDSAGNLSTAGKLIDSSNPANPVYATTTYIYNNLRFPHLLTEVKDPRGVSVLRCVFDDSGRLVATLDALGNRTDISQNIAGRTTTVFDRLGNPTQYVYDDHGNVLSTTDPLGRTTLETWDANNNLTSVTDPLGNTTRYEYDSSGRPTAFTDPAGHRTVIGYDGNGKPTSVVDALGHVSTNVFDGSGRLTALINPLGQSSTLQYDGQGRLSSFTDSLGNAALQLAYDGSGNPTTVAAPNHPPTTITYDNNGNPLSAQFQWINPDNPSDVRAVTASKTYDDSGRLIQSTDGRGNKTGTVYDDAGDPVLTIDPLGNLSTNLFDLAGNLIESTFSDHSIVQSVYDANARVVMQTDRHLPGQPAFGTRSIYDAAGQLISTERHTNVVIAINPVTLGTVTGWSSAFISSGGVISSNAMQYDVGGRLLASTDASGQTTTYEYDALGHRTAMVDAQGNRIQLAYDAAGHTTSITDPVGREVDYLYDAAGRRTRTVYPDGSSSTVAYDANGRPQAQTDPQGHVRQFQYDAGGRLTAVTMPLVVDPLSSNAVVNPVFQYVYDTNGNLRTVVDPNGRQTVYRYNEFNQQVGRVLPLGQTNATFYDNYGRPQRAVDFDGQTTESLYDSLGRLVGQNYYAAGSNAPGSGYQIVFDSNSGVLSQVVEERGVTRYAYDHAGHVTQIASPEGTLNYGFDPVTGRRNRTWTDNSDQRFTYDTLGRLETVSVVKRDGQVLAAPEITTYSYLADGRRASVILPNGVQTLYTYDQLGRLSRLQHVATNGTLLASFSYLHAPNNLRTSLTEVVRSPAGAYHTNAITYGYDSLDRLVYERGTDLGSGSNYVAAYTYDLVGNRLERDVTVAGRTLKTWYTYDANDRLLQESNSVISASAAKPSTASTAPAGAAGRAARLLATRTEAAAWSYYTLKAIPYVLAVSFLLPGVLLVQRRRQRPALCTLDLSPRRALFPRCLSGLLAALMALSGLDCRVLADQAVLYAALTTDTWGLDGSVTTYQYDANGSVVNKTTSGAGAQTVNYAYDLAGRLASARTSRTQGGNQVAETVSYTYNLQGIRVQIRSALAVNGIQQSASTNYILVDPLNHTFVPQVLEESAAPGALPTVSYTLGADVVGQSVAGEVKYFLADGHASTRLLADAGGDVTDTYGYDAYGVMLGGNPTTANPAQTKLLYNGQQFDTQLQQYYLRARTYDQSNGRFTSQDPLPGSPQDPASLHRYVYASADPVNRMDPLGQQDLGDVMCAVAIIGILSTMALGGLSLYRGGNYNPDAAIWGGSLTFSVSPLVGGVAALTLAGITAFAVSTYEDLNIDRLFGLYGGAVVLGSGALQAWLDQQIAACIGGGVVASPWFLSQTFSLGFEWMATVTDKKFGLYWYWAVGPAFSASGLSGNVDVSVTAYAGVVWGVPTFDSYKGAFQAIGLTFNGGDLGVVLNYFWSPNDPKQFGVAIGLTASLGGVSFGGSYTGSNYRILLPGVPMANDAPLAWALPPGEDVILRLRFRGLL